MKKRTGNLSAVSLLSHTQAYGKDDNYHFGIVLFLVLTILKRYGCIVGVV